jgi:RNA polymerase sigma factor (sigma-70 family)
MPRLATSPIIQFVRGIAENERAKQLTDQELLDRFRSTRDEASFQALVRRHGVMVLEVCRNVLDNEVDSEDAFQATFLIFAQKAGAIRKNTSLGSWLYGVAYRAACKAREGSARRRRRETRALAPSAGQSAQAGQSADDLSWREVRQVLHEELAGIATRYQAPLVACYLQGRTQDEAARLLCVSKTTLKHRLDRGRALLRTRLVRRGLGALAVLVTAAWPAARVSAQVPPRLVSSTTGAAILVAAGQALTLAGISANVAALAQGVLKTMFVTKMKTVAATLLLLGLLVGGLLLTELRGQPARPLAPRTPDTKEPTPRNQAEDKARRVTDAFGDALPAGAVGRLGTVRWRHSTPVNFLALPDVTTAISAAKDRFVRVWDWSSGEELRRFGPGPRARENTDSFVVLGRPTEMVVALSADGKVLATKFAEPVVDLWQVATGKKLGSVSVAKKDVQAMAKTDHEAIGLAVSPNGKKLALYTTDGKVRIWDVDAQKIVREFGQASGQSAQSMSAQYTPDGKCLIGVRTEYDVGAVVGYMHLWDSETGRELRSLKLTSRFGPLSFVCSPDSKLLAYNWDGQICIVKTDSGEKVTQWESMGAAMVFGADSSKLYCKLGHEAVIREHDVATGKELRHFDTTSVPSFYFRQGLTASLALSPDGKRLAVGGDTNAIRVVDVASGKELPALGGHADEVRHVGFLPDGKSVFSAANLGAAIWDAGTSKRLKQIGSENDGHFAVSMDSRYLATVGPKQSVVVRDTTSNKPVLTIPRAKNVDSFPVFCFSPDGRILLIRRRNENSAVLHDLPSGNERCRVAVTDNTGLPGRPTDTFFFSTDGSRLAVFSPGTRLTVHDASNGKRLQEITLDLEPDSVVRWEQRLVEIRSAAFAPDGRTIAFDRGDGVVQLIELASAQERRPFGAKHTFKELKEPFGGFWSKTVESQMPGCGTVSFSPDGRLLAQAAVDHVVNVWDVATGKLLAPFHGHRGAIFSVAFSPDGRRLVTGSADTTALIWDVDGLSAKAAPAPRALAAAEAQSHWHNLAAEARTAADAMNALVASPAEAVAVCKEHLRPVPPVDAAAVSKLIEQFDSTTFKIRDKAQTDLLDLGDVVVPYLEKALARNNPLETQRRLEKIHNKLTNPALTGDRLRSARAIEVLERIGSEDARRLLQVLADGAPGASLTTQARASLRRSKKL